MASSLSSGVSSLSSSSTNSSNRSSPAKENINVNNVVSSQKVTTVQPSQDSVRKAFEAQLIAGKNRLKKANSSNSEGVAEVGQMAKPPPAPVPPPPPAPASLLLHKEVRSYEIPQAPKLKKPSLANKKGLVAPNGLSAREELMMAIRGTGGFQGLRKV